MSCSVCIVKIDTPIIALNNLVICRGNMDVLERIILNTASATRKMPPQKAAQSIIVMEYCE